MDKKKLTVFFKPGEVQVKQEDASKSKTPAGHLGGLIPYKVWQKSALVSVTWAVRWPPVAAKGLQPIRPMLCAKTDLVIPANQAVLIAEP